MKIFFLFLFPWICFSGENLLFPVQGDIVSPYIHHAPSLDYEKREFMIPMRDGVQLYTIIYIPKNSSKKSPLLMTRTPYNASNKQIQSDFDKIFMEDDYIRVYQDTRGRNKSQGNYVMTQPIIGVLNPTQVDHSTDTYDTIEYLIKNIPETNGNVGITGCSYEGFTAAMGLINPHKALKASVPIAPMIDGWVGDDWMRNGIFRQVSFGFILSMTTSKISGAGMKLPIETDDDYKLLKKIGSAGDFAKLYNFDQLPFWQRMKAHPHYDIFWQNQALDKILINNPSKIPTMWVHGIWDQDDIYGSVQSYEGLVKENHQKNNFFLAGPWNHCQIFRNGNSLGSLTFNGDTSKYARENIIKPFFDLHLKGKKSKKVVAATIYNTGKNEWENYSTYPVNKKSKSIYLDSSKEEMLTWDKPKKNEKEIYDEFISDPNKPVPNMPRPVHLFENKENYSKWLVDDQRFVSDRTDVLVYQTKEFESPINMNGIPKVTLYVSTSETDADFVVKLIDVYPHKDSKNEMNGYQLPLSIQIFRGRYHESKANPRPLEKNKIYKLEFDLTFVNHEIQKGNKLMIHIQSSLFPLYDRNPQEYVENPFHATKENYKKAVHKIYKDGEHPSGIELPLFDKVL